MESTFWRGEAFAVALTASPCPGHALGGHGEVRREGKRQVGLRPSVEDGEQVTARRTATRQLTARLIVCAETARAQV